MTLAFVPIPTTPEHLFAWREHWLPFLASISKRSKEPIPELLDAVISGRVQIALVWDGEKAHALAGMQYRRSGEAVIAEIIWLSGKGMKEWRHLLPELERYLKDIGCTIIKPICRIGWSRILKQHGYKTTHLVMERAL